MDIIINETTLISDNIVWDNINILILMFPLSILEAMLL